MSTDGPPNAELVEMSCKELVETITAYLEGTLSAGDRLRFERHLEECPWCVTYLAQMRETIATLGRLDEETLAPETREGLLAAFRGWRSSG